MADQTGSGWTREDDQLLADRMQAIIRRDGPRTEDPAKPTITENALALWHSYDTTEGE